MLRRALQTSLLLLSLCLLTGPLALLQLGAWSWMLASYSKESSIEQAFRETFGGERPCELCKAIDSVDRSQTDPAPGLPNQELKQFKLMLGLGREIVFPSQAGRIEYPMIEYTRPLGWTQCVPTPPPRQLA